MIVQSVLQLCAAFGAKSVSFIYTSPSAVGEVMLGDSS